jgi:ketosteroid isomerase-like protein
MSQENVEAVKRSFDGWNRGDVDAWVRDAHPDAEFSSAIMKLTEGRDRAFQGRAEMRKFWDEWRSLWDLNVELSEIRDLGNTVVALGAVKIRGKASGIELESPVGYVIEFDEGLFRTVDAYLDPQDALKAAGLEE